MQYAVGTGAEYIFVDVTGVGASCCDFLKFRGIRHTRVVFSSPPDDPQQFLNKRVEMWWRLRQWFGNQDTCMAAWEGLLEDLISPEYGVRDNAKTYMESKEDMRKRGIRSPDLGDALAMTFYLPYSLTTMRCSRNSGTKMNTYIEKYNQEWRREALGTGQNGDSRKKKTYSLSI